ncbi:response regulator transcription factor [Nocardioides sp. YIM 152315]|uniref:response regulator transcription factor n=1 Tax=Nocardioides sp. YIM 152315 TaxID=3031760 RepID=UPI0023DA23A2|nr:response regulator transcription factor [Nocardioides sp. YIM 152315]MDF1606065.1 response regulator transcription factor [Nocardioides sp. YIM 152315]
MSERREDLTRPIRVALSNDYEIALLGLAQMLARYPGQVQVVDITTNPELVQHHPDVILYDTFGRLPEHDEKLRQIVAEQEAKVVVYSWDDYPEEAARRLGAVGYLPKSLSAAELVAAIIAIQGSDHPRPAEQQEEPVLTWPGQHLGLSQREAEMMSFITRGLSNDEIARRAYLSINTVKTYIRTAYAKIGVSNRAQAVAWGFRHGFESTDDTGL